MAHFFSKVKAARRQSGATILIVVLSLLAFMTVLFFGIALAYAYRTRLELQNALDSATIGAISEARRLQAKDVKELAKLLARNNFPALKQSHTLRVSIEPFEGQDPETGIAKSITLSATAVSDNYLLNMLPAFADTLTVSGSSKASTQTLLVALLLDVSASMDWLVDRSDPSKGKRIDALMNAASFFVGRLLPGVDRVALIPFGPLVIKPLHGMPDCSYPKDPGGNAYGPPEDSYLPALDIDQIRAKITAPCMRGAYGGTNFSRALTEAQRLFLRSNDLNMKKRVILFSDGIPNSRAWTQGSIPETCVLPDEPITYTRTPANLAAFWASGLPYPSGVPGLIAPVTDFVQLPFPGDPLGINPAPDYPREFKKSWFMTINLADQIRDAFGPIFVIGYGENAQHYSDPYQQIFDDWNVHSNLLARLANDPIYHSREEDRNAVDFPDKCVKRFDQNTENVGRYIEAATPQELIDAFEEISNELDSVRFSG